MNWDNVWSRIEPCYQAVAATVTASVPWRLRSIDDWSFPTLPHAIERSPEMLVSPFHTILYFMFDPVHGDHDDASIELACWREGSVHTMTCEIRGKGARTLRQLDPQALPRDPQGMEYERAVAEFIDEAVTFLAENTHLIVEELRAHVPMDAEGSRDS
jgi:hypothetical protein